MVLAAVYSIEKVYHLSIYRPFQSLDPIYTTALTLPIDEDRIIKFELVRNDLDVFTIVETYTSAQVFTAAGKIIELNKPYPPPGASGQPYEWISQGRDLIAAGREGGDRNGILKFWRVWHSLDKAVVDVAK